MDEKEIVSVESLAYLTLAEGEYRHDFRDNLGLTPLLKMCTLGHNFVSAAIHAGGLRYHGESPLLHESKKEKYIELCKQ